MHGTFYLFPHVYLFSIYQHLQYVPVIFVSAYLMALYGLWQLPRFKKVLLILIPVMGLYAAASVSISALVLLFSGIIILIIHHYYKHGLDKALAIAVMIMFVLSVGYLYLGRNVSTISQKYGFFSPVFTNPLVWRRIMWRKRGVFLALWVALFALATSGCGGGFSSLSAPPPGTPPAVALTTIATGLNSPVDLQTPDDNSGRMFVVEQSGTIRIIVNNALLPTPFLNIATKVTFSGEMGLLGAAFHPAFSQNQKFYLNYVHSSGGVIQSFIAEYQVSAADPNQADPAS